MHFVNPPPLTEPVAEFICVFTRILCMFTGWVSMGETMRKKIKYWRDDSFLSQNGTILKYDKLEHGILGLIGMLATLIWVKPAGIQQVVLIWLVWNGIGLAWELFQTYALKQVVEIKDMAANNAGFILSALLYLLY